MTAHRVSVSLDPRRLESLALKIESSLVLVKAVAAALSNRSFDISSLYPPGSAAILPFFNRVPARIRNPLIHFGVAAQSHPLSSFPSICGDDIARWCVSQYPDRSYPVIVLGATNGAAAHLAALLGAPLLTTHLVFGIKNRRARRVGERHPSVIEEETAIGEKCVNTILPPDSGLDAILHYDPYHDRFLVNAMTLIRLKMNRIPGTYAEFIRSHLAPGGVLIINDCKYPWKVARLSELLTLQIGGLGGVSPDEYLRLYALPGLTAIETAAESEWGTPPAFADSVANYAGAANLRAMRIQYGRPDALSAAVASLAADRSGSNNLLLDCFSFIDPFTSRSRGLPAYWLPFNTSDCLDQLKSFVADKQFETAYFSLVPALAPCPDMPEISEWRAVLQGHCRRIVDIGLSRWYPADSFAAFRFVRDLKAATASLPRNPLSLTVADLGRSSFSGNTVELK